jgi:hypothetical protein
MASNCSRCDTTALGRVPCAHTRSIPHVGNLHRASLDSGHQRFLLEAATILR